MANSTVQMLQARVAQNPHDTEAWQLLSEEQYTLYQADPARQIAPFVETLKAIVQRYPTAAKQWKALADIELERGNNRAAKDIFSQCLVACSHVGLWTSYLVCIKSDNARTGDNGQLEIMRAYEYTLEKLGQDSAAGTLWWDFLQFMLAVPVHSNAFQKLFLPEPGKEASKRALRLRDLFQRALQVPSDQLDRLWAEYERFERATAARNSPTAARFIDDWKPRYQAAREAWASRRRLLEAIDRDALPHEPGRSPPWAHFREQYALWGQLLEQERANAQGLDAKTLRRRVDTTYQQALAPLRHCPEVWLQWADAWHEDPPDARRAHAMDVLQQARAALPDCVMLAFALADLHEETRANDKAADVYEELIRQMQEGEGGGLPAEAGNAVWMQYMRFQKRTGTTLQDGQWKARRTFLRASKWPHCSWHVFACHALMEWQLQRMTQPQELGPSITVVKKIFEHGLRQPQIQSAPGYIETFADWLVRTMGDVENARMLFLNALADDACQRDAAMWDAFLRFEARNGTLQDIVACEQWRAAALSEAPGGRPHLDGVGTLVSRYKHFDLWPCSLQQRGHLETCLRRGTPGSSAPDDDAGAHLPSSLALLLTKLPPSLEPDQPLPDVDLVLDVILRAKLDAAPTGKSVYDETRAPKAQGAKRPLASDELGGSLAPLFTDVFRMRQKMKVEGA